ncbi:MAG: hypothetical protein CL674_07665 [Bdellovibrionaceae bacterium]|nr:hypothetical protein [Pseudobdellovibrionaceae bacterium]|tara:strand:- start:5941 stop:6597 length:657 start_codon:yes stop_codon:yes gene_type:complete
MNRKLILSGIIVTSLLGFSSFAEDGHDHSSHGTKEKHSKEDNHDHSDGDGHNHKKKKKKDSHADHDDHGHKGHSEDDGHDHDEHKEEDGHDHGSHEGHGGGKAIGKGKAIEEVDEKKGFKLSKEAIKTLKLKLNTVDGSSFKISKKTLVASKNKKGVYRFRAGFFKFMPAKITKELSDGYQVEVKGVDFGDQIVVNGVGLLRLTDVYSTDKSEYGHSH